MYKVNSLVRVGTGRTYYVRLCVCLYSSGVVDGESGKD